MQNCGLFTAGPQPCTNLVQQTVFSKVTFKTARPSQFYPWKNLWWGLGQGYIFRLQNCNFTKSNSIMLFFWEFSKLLQSIIFRNFSICVEKLNYIKNYMKTRRENRKGGQPSPHFVLRNRTEHLYYTWHVRSTKYEKFIKTFLKRDQDRHHWRFFCEEKPTLFSSFGFFSIDVFTEEFHSLLCFYHS